MKKFKHKKLGWVAEEHNKSLYKIINLVNHIAIPIELIENSEDWEEIKGFILTTEDGVDLFDGNHYYVVNSKYEVVEDIISKHITYKNKIVKRFAKKENAEEYVLMNQKLLSLQDLLSVLDTFGNFQYSDAFMNFKQKAIKNKEI